MEKERRNQRRWRFRVRAKITAKYSGRTKPLMLTTKVFSQTVNALASCEYHLSRCCSPCTLTNRPGWRDLSDNHELLRNQGTIAKDFSEAKDEACEQSDHHRISEPY